MRDGVSETAQNVEIEMNATIGAIRGYANRYPKEIAGKSHVKYVQFEAPFKVDVKWPTVGDVTLVGLIDMVGMSDKYTYLAETKSTAQISATFKEDIELAPQMMFYLLAYIEKFPLMIAKKARLVFNYLRKPSIRPRKNETLKAYMIRVTEDYGARPEFYFNREVQARTRQQVESFKAELIDIISDIRRTTKRNLWYRNRKACNARGRCFFFDICAFGEIPSVMSAFRNKTAHHEELKGGTDGKATEKTK